MATVLALDNGTDGKLDTALLSSNVFHVLAGVTAGVSTVVGTSPAMKRGLTGSAASLSVAVAPLLVVHRMTAAVGGTSGAAAVLSVAEKLTGATAGVSSATASITNTKFLAGDSDAVGAVSGVLDTTPGDDTLVPRLDVAVNGWTTQSGSSTDLYAVLAELVEDDADYIRSIFAPTTADYYEAALEGRPDPVSSSGHVAHYAYAKSGPEVLNLTVGLYQGASLIASWLHSNVGTSFVTQNQTLSGAEADAISDYGDLRLRFTPAEVSSGIGSERMAPDALTLQTNLTGTLANIDDDPDSPDALWLVATGNTVTTTAHVTFGTPAVSLASGAGLQEFRVQVRKDGSGGTGTPTVQIHLYENGTLVSSGSSTNVTSTTGQVVSYTWDATGRTASLIECRVVGTPSGGGPAVRAAVDVGAIEWNAATALADSRALVSWANFEIPAFAVGGPQALDGSTDGTSAAAATLAVSRSLSGSADGDSTVAATLSVAEAQHALVGSTAGTSTVLAALVVAEAQHALVGSSAGVSVATAALTLTEAQHALAGSTAGASSAIAPLLVARPLAGSSAAASSATGTVSTAAQHALTGSVAGLSAVTAVLSVAEAQSPLVGSTAGSSTAGGTLSVAEAQWLLVGSTAGISTAGAALSVAEAQWPLAGITAGSATLTGSVAVAHTLVGSAAGAGTGSGTLAASRTLAAVATGASSTTAALSVAEAQWDLLGSTAASSTAGASLNVHHVLSGASSGQSTAAASLSVIEAHSGAAAGASTSTGTLVVSRPLSGTTSGVSLAFGTVDTLIALAPRTFPLSAVLADDGRRHVVISRSRLTALLVGNGARSVALASSRRSASVDDPERLAKVE